MTGRETAPPTFGTTSFPSSSYHYPSSSSTGFVPWASRPSPYQAMTPWVSYSSPSYPLNTAPPASSFPSYQASYKNLFYSCPPGTVYPSSQPGHSHPYTTSDTAVSALSSRRSGPSRLSGYESFTGSSTSDTLCPSGHDQPGSGNPPNPSTFNAAEPDTSSLSRSISHPNPPCPDLMLENAAPAVSSPRSHVGIPPLPPSDVTRPPSDGRPIKTEKQSQTASSSLGIRIHTEPADRTDRTDRTDRASTQSPAAPAPRAKSISLNSLNIQSISESKVLYYFGVLATEALLLPRFYFTSGRKTNKWGGKMTMYGMTHTCMHVYTYRRSARVSLCREALKRLKVEFPNWVVPERPGDSMTNPRWDWVELLREYCVHHTLLEPKYTKYAHHKGYRHEVKVDGTMYFGFLRYYPTERSSKQGAAHEALYDVLVQGDDEDTGTQGLPTLKTSDEALLSMVPREPLHKFPKSRIPARRKLDDRDESRSVKIRRRKSKPPATYSEFRRSIPPRNANLQPLEYCRIAAIKSPVAEAQRRWRVTPSEIPRRLQGIDTWVAKLEKLCDLLPLEHPEIQIESSDGRLLETEGEYTATAYFKSDPFLARAGAIGHVQSFSGTRDAVHEACAREVSNYLIRMVDEDTALENAAAEERQAINQWGETAAS
ncbi:hypothetical protein BDW59DRAFT_147030 [Aspergillus cavernicola]|uniref:Uncharacterized protein n=1 Tax=Aspergillus cavernicola TaxID=176166 RepID=A0ABR4IBR6_9EURO